MIQLCALQGQVAHQTHMHCRLHTGVTVHSWRKVNCIDRDKNHRACRIYCCELKEVLKSGS